MRPILTAMLFALAGTTAAAASCPSHPDTAATGFVENRTAQALCLQRELADRVARAAEEARLDAELGNIEIELERQRRLVQQRLALPDRL